MNNNEVELFEAYYHQRMGENESAIFKEKLRADSALFKRYRKYQLVIKSAKLTRPESVVRQHQRENKETEKPIRILQDDLQQDLKNKEKSKVSEANDRPRIIPIYRKKIFRRLAIAGVLLLGVALFLIRSSFLDEERIASANNINLENKSLADEMYVKRNRGFAETQQLYSGLREFKNDKYTPAVKDLTLYIQSASLTKVDTAYYFLGESYRALEDFEKALLNLEKVDDSSKLYNHKYMSLALTFLRLEQQQAAQQAAEKVMLNKQDDTYHLKASKLVKKLKYGFFAF